MKEASGVNWLKRVFSGSVDLSRVNGIGIAVMAVGLLAVILAPRIAGRIKKDDKNAAAVVKLVGLIIVMAGTLIAILG